MNIKYGFIIDIDKKCIYDTKIPAYKLKKTSYDKNIIYYLKPIRARLYLYEPLLEKYSTDKVFEILKFNKRLKKRREIERKKDKLHHIANMAVIDNYPPKYLKQKKFYLYKTLRRLKNQIDTNNDNT